jgi:hypothetical protein
MPGAEDILKPTMRLRFLEREGPADAYHVATKVRVLQQYFEDGWGGNGQWRDVEVVVETEGQ